MSIDKMYDRFEKYMQPDPDYDKYCAGQERTKQSKSMRLYIFFDQLKLALEKDFDEKIKPALDEYKDIKGWILSHEIDIAQGD